MFSGAVDQEWFMSGILPLSVSVKSQNSVVIVAPFSIIRSQLRGPSPVISATASSARPAAKSASRTNWAMYVLQEKPFRAT